MNEINNELFQYFLRNPLDIKRSLPDLLRKSDDLSEIANNQVSQIAENEALQLIDNDERFKFHNSDLKYNDQLKKARIEILSYKINKIVIKKRMDAIHNSDEQGRALPYNHPALTDIHLVDNDLINIKNFDLSDKRLVRNSHEFFILPTLPALNSSTFLWNELLSISAGEVFIRLDPFLLQSKDDNPQMHYKMWVYGVPLDWDKTTQLKKENHCKWMPDYPDSSDIAFTDAVWLPKGDEIHFTCEEVPKEINVDIRGSRYFHSTYSTNTKKWHIDGAVRLYDKNSIQTRHKKHVRNAGKMGKRVKIFYVSGKGDFPKEECSALASSFFVWNEDAMNYFTGQKSM